MMILAAVFVFAMTVFCCADTVPCSTSPEPCAIYVNGNAAAGSAVLHNGNVYVDINTLRTYGAAEGWAFDEGSNTVSMDISVLDVWFGDEETTNFIKRNLGTVSFKLSDMSAYGYYGLYISLGSVADLARLEWTYKDGAVYIVPYESFQAPLALATGNETVYTTAAGDEECAALRENQLLRIVGYENGRTRLADCAGNQFFIPDDQVSTVYDTSEIHSFSRQYREKDSFDEAINAMWSDLSYCPDKIDGLDVLADIAFYPWASSDGSSYEGCVNVCNYGIIQAAKARGYKWWLCAQNFNTSIGHTYDHIDSNLKDRASANRLIAQYLFYTCVFDADGINIDYEEMDSSCRNYFISFMQTLCRHADKLGLTTSVCTYCGTVWNNATIYPYDILGQCCDFICEMVYNEDISSSLSPMSRPYYIAGTDYIGTLAPHNRVLMGVADYTRYTYWSGDWMAGSIWLTLNGVWSDQEGMSMWWDDYTGQYYAEQPYIHYGVEYLAKFYVEEARSSALKAQYIVDGGYGGTIGWIFNYMNIGYPEVQGIYDAYYNIYHNGGSYYDFVP